MSVGKMLEAFHNISEAIWESFGVEDGMGEWIEDFTNCNWKNHFDDEVSIIKDGDEYSFEIYGTSIWAANGFVLCKVYNGSGEMYCIMMSSKFEVTDEDVWEGLVEQTLKEE